MHPRTRSTSAHQSLAVIRIAAATVLLVHGVYRLTHAGFVEGFGTFLGDQGIPFGGQVAMAITLWEVAGALLLLLARWTRWVALIFAVELTGGLLMVHAREGWFVVGGGRNGMEFAALLIVIMLALAWDDRNASGNLVHPGSG